MKQPSEELVDAICATAELCGATLSKPAAKMLALDLAQYDQPAVFGALARCRAEVTGRLTAAAVVQRLTDGRPGSDEAWATFPKAESESAACTQEQLSAWVIASDLYANGDHVAARIAFKQAYERLCAEARSSGKPCEWFPTLGWEHTGREHALIEAARLGRLPGTYILRWLPPEAQARACAALGIAMPALPGPDRKQDIAALAAAVARREAFTAPATTLEG